MECCHVYSNLYLVMFDFSSSFDSSRRGQRPEAENKGTLLDSSKSDKEF
jgi:hypothetical protein